MTSPRPGRITIAFDSQSVVIKAEDLNDPGFYYGAQEQTYYELGYSTYGKPYVKNPVLKRRNIFTISANIPLLDARKIYNIYLADHDELSAYETQRKKVRLIVSGDFPLLINPPAVLGSNKSFDVKLNLSNDFLSKFIGSAYVSDSVTNVDDLSTICTYKNDIPFVEVSFTAEEISDDSSFDKKVKISGVENLDIDWQHWKANGFSVNTVASNQPKLNYSDYGVPYIAYPLLSFSEKVYTFNVYLTEGEVEKIKKMVESSKLFFISGSGVEINLTDEYFGSETKPILIEIGEDFGSNLIGLSTRDGSSELEYLYDCSFKAYSYGAEDTAFNRTVDISGFEASVELNYKNFTKSGFAVNPYSTQQVNPSYNPFGFSIVKNISFVPKTYYSFNLVLEEEKVTAIRSMVNESNARFSLGIQGGITISDGFFNRGSKECALMISDDFGSNIFGIRDQEILYSCTLKAVEL